MFSSSRKNVLKAAAALAGALPLFIGCADPALFSEWRSTVGAVELGTQSQWAMKNLRENWLMKNLEQLCFCLRRKRTGDETCKAEIHNVLEDQKEGASEGQRKLDDWEELWAELDNCGQQEQDAIWRGTNGLKNEMQEVVKKEEEGDKK